MTGRDDIAARVTALADRLDRGPSVSDGYAAGTTHFHEFSPRCFQPSLET